MTTPARTIFCKQLPRALPIICGALRWQYQVLTTSLSAWPGTIRKTSMNLRKIWLIAKREYTFNFRRRSFLFAAFGVPLITIVMIGVVLTLVQQAAEDISGYKHVGIVDQDGVLVDSSGASTIKLTAPFEIVASQEAAQAAVEKNALDGYFVIPKGFRQSGQIEMYSLPSNALSEGLQKKAEELIKQALAQQIGDASLVARLQDPLKDLEVY